MQIRAKKTAFSAAKPSWLLKKSSRSSVLCEGRYSVKVAKTSEEILGALRLRFDVFTRELSGGAEAANSASLEFDEYDRSSRHLLVIENETQKTVGTYRLRTIENAKNAAGFYSFTEFGIEDLPNEVLNQSIEIGRACIAREHRNTRVLFLLWKGLANYLKRMGKRYFFGCCSVFTQDTAAGAEIFRRLERDGHLHKTYRVNPRAEKICPLDESFPNDEPPELPALFNMYLRLGAKICGAPIIDREFKTIDFFVLFDSKNVSEKYRKMFLD